MRWSVLAFCLFWFLLGNSCRQLREINLPMTAEMSAERQLEQAYDAIKKQQHEEALALFERIARTYKTGIIQQYARYGIACTRMATAESAAEMEAAMSEWVYWFQQTPEKYRHEDPKLMDQVLHNYRVHLNKEAARITKWQDQRAWFHTELKKRQKQVETLQRQIEELQQKIDAIETIHQDIQEKRV